MDDEEELLEDHERPRINITNSNVPGLPNFHSLATLRFFNDTDLSPEFKTLVAWCMAAEWQNRPSVAVLLNVCEQMVRTRTISWMRLADEVTDLFDSVAPETNDDSDSEYLP